MASRSERAAALEQARKKKAKPKPESKRWPGEPDAPDEPGILKNPMLRRGQRDRINQPTQEPDFGRRIVPKKA